MKAGGETTKPMEREDSFMLTVMSTMACGSMIRHMDTEFTATWMVLSMKEIGKRTSNMD